MRKGNAGQYGSRRAVALLAIALAPQQGWHHGAASIVALSLIQGELTLPVSPACISSPFGPRHIVGPRAANFHNGIDFPAPVGATVHAVRAGQVVAIRRLGAEGLEVDVRHEGPDGGFVTRYAHLGSVAPALAEGQRMLVAGAPIGRVGRTGITYGTHLHFEIRVRDQPIDPAPFFSVTRCG